LPRAAFNSVNDKAVMTDAFGHDSFFSACVLSAIVSKGVEQRDFVRFYIAVVERQCAREIPAG
jgi:hypothetical protein